MKQTKQNKTTNKHSKNLARNQVKKKESNDHEYLDTLTNELQAECVEHSTNSFHGLVCVKTSFRAVGHILTTYCTRQWTKERAQNPAK